MADTTTKERKPARKWYIVHTYSGFEERVKETLKQRAEALGMGDKFGEIRIPTETIVELRGGRSARPSASSSRATSWSRWRCPTSRGTW
jgi:transcriptional antiterminator NusG